MGSMDLYTIQTHLIALGFRSRIASGKRDDAYFAEVRSFQNAYGLVVDGIAGPQTQTALKRAASASAAKAKAEPDKSAMAGSTPAQSTGSISVSEVPPPNVSSIKLLGTARPISEIIVHCAATPEGRDYTVDDIRAWHKARGWSDIGYHYVVYRDGRVMAGRPVGQAGSHVAGHNTGTIGITYVGGVSVDGKTAKDTRTPAQRASLIWLVRQLIDRHPAIHKVSGHNQYAAKACPSFDVRRDQLGRLVKA